MFCVGLYNGELRQRQHQKAFRDSTPHKICVHVFLKKSLAPIFKFSEQPACLPAGKQLGRYLHQNPVTRELRFRDFPRSHIQE